MAVPEPSWEHCKRCKNALVHDNMPACTPSSTPHSRAWTTGRFRRLLLLLYTFVGTCWDMLELWLGFKGSRLVVHPVGQTSHIWISTSVLAKENWEKHALYTVFLILTDSEPSQKQWRVKTNAAVIAVTVSECRTMEAFLTIARKISMPNR